MWHSFTSPVRDAPTVLIAEDEVLIRFALYDGLTDRGVRVLEAGTAAEAIHVLEAEPGIDLVFTDIRMPGPLDGLDLVRWVHSHRPGTPVVVTSGGIHKEDIAADVRADEPFIAKPYDLDSVVERITDLAREYQHQH
ncbi:MAG TPA: response regulator [Rhizomicrobium sp.]|nr:response regulator [Rhizomicrobium sp.]